MSTRDIPFVELPGSAGWWSAYEQAAALAERFPGQDADQLVYACEYNAGPPSGATIVEVLMLEQGAHDEGDWVWQVRTSDGLTWVATGGCDYTGWDCQSDLRWHPVAEGLELSLEDQPVARVLIADGAGVAEAWAAAAALREGVQS